MEVIGTLSSAITVADLAVTSVCKTIRTLKRLKHAPKEVEDVLEQVEGIISIIRTVSELAPNADTAYGLIELLDRLKRQLLELEQFIHFKLIKPTGELEVNRTAWSRHVTEVSRLLTSISQTINYLNVTLSAVTLLQLTHLQKRIEQSSASNEISLHTQSQSISSLSEKIDNLNLLSIQQSSANEEQLRLEAEKHTHLDSSSLITQPLMKMNREKNIPNRMACSKSCRCQCHKARSLQTFSILRQWIGALHISFTNFESLRPRCNAASCQRSADQDLTVQYTFPSWLAGARVLGSYKRSVWGSVDRHIRVIQIVETDAFSFVVNGDVSSLRALYSQGRASVHDISLRSGYTALVQAIIYEQHNVVRFLIDNGAEKTQEDLYGIDANDTVLEEYLRSKGSTRFESISALFDFDGLMEEQQFTLLHRVVVGRSSYRLADALEDFQEYINTSDMSGRTPVFWAVWLEDVEIVRLLLSCGADVKAAARDGRTIFHLMTQMERGLEIFSILTGDDMLQILSAQDLRYCINRSDSGGHSPLHLAICYSSDYGSELLDAFLNHGGDLSLTSAAFGQTSFHYILMHADAATVSCVFKDLSSIDLNAIDNQGETAIDLLVARLNDETLLGLIDSPSSSSEDLVALVEYVSYARKFDSRLPRIIYGPRLGIMDVGPSVCLFKSLGNTSDTTYEWPEWVDVEDWCGKYGHLDIPANLDSDLSKKKTFFGTLTV